MGGRHQFPPLEGHNLLLYHNDLVPQNTKNLYVSTEVMDSRNQEYRGLHAMNAQVLEILNPPPPSINQGVLQC
jgi:hypothetical protein